MILTHYYFRSASDFETIWRCPSLPLQSEPDVQRATPGSDCKGRLGHLQIVSESIGKDPDLRDSLAGAPSSREHSYPLNRPPAAQMLVPSSHFV